ncbi:hypothetical protein M2401_003613 [Pseudomonas sp. JUb42]|uniref:hypothetical protein n=1 Tax=Pseudomonas sp. JUb42 TaxID=2940611 RepID=UPI002167BA08|nr:hypothetical protein [Pseudomonas sp. JUb42]MCS3469873.1 hypothetical protein [Pseudomonas sp. JUb42]
MNQLNPSDRYLPLTQSGQDSPILLLDTQAPLTELHAYTSLRFSLAAHFLDGLACADGDEHDWSAIAGTLHLLMQEACAVDRVIEQRLWRGCEAGIAPDLAL